MHNIILTLEIDYCKEGCLIKGLAAGLLVLMAALSVFLVGFASVQVYAGVLAAEAESPPEVGAEAYVVMDAATGQILVAKNAGRLEYPASITKIMTLALALEQLGISADRNAPVTVSAAAVDALIPRATMIALAPGEVAALNDILYAVKIESANDAAHALAEYVSGSMAAFARAMNEKARALGLEGSHFINASGQPDDAHYTTALDMAEITRWALGVPGFRELFAATRYSMPPTNMQPSGREFHNANMALVPHSGYYCEGVTGSKTGYTDQARYTLATTARRGDTELICVVMNCADNESKYLSTNALMDYCFNNFRRVEYTPGAAVNCKVPVYGGASTPLGEIDVYADGSVSFLLHNSLPAEAVAVETEIPEQYLIGRLFSPSASLSLPDGLSQQQGYQLAVMPLSWRGLEQLLTVNTAPEPQGFSLNLVQIAAEEPVLFWLAAAPSALGLGLVGIFAVKRLRHARLRKKRLMAVRAQLPVRIAERPPPPLRSRAGGAPVDFRRPDALPLRAANDAGYGSPHRPGQAR